MSNNESFEARVKRLFGPRLFDDVPNSSFPASSWSVAGGAVERREWNRDKGDHDRDNDPCAAAFDDENGCFARTGGKRDRKKEWEGNLGDDEYEVEEEEQGRGEDDEEREIRKSVGLDPKLDHEEEEDEYDRAAFNKENAEDRVYMRDVMTTGPGLSYQLISDLQDDGFEEIYDYDRDPRADHFAARVRLNKETKETEHGCSNPVQEDGKSVSFQKRSAEDDANLKSILKRRTTEIDSKPKKRVRFDPEWKGNDIKTVEETHDSHMVPQIVETTAVADLNSRSVEKHGVPDYLINPSKYTCYTLDWSDDDDKLNMQAFQDFHGLVSKSSPGMILDKSEESSVELPKSIAFIPRKRPHDLMPVNSYSDEGSIKECSEKVTCSTSIMAGESHENDVCEMDEDKPAAEETALSRKDGRKYRSKPSLES